MVYCRTCGLTITQEMDCCPQCGTKLTYANVVFPSTASQASPVSSRVSTASPVARPKRRSRAKIAVAVILLLIVIIFAFEALGEYSAATSLTESLSGVGVSNIGFTSATVVLTVSFNNPSGHATPPFNSDFTVSLSGTQIGTGSLPETTVDAGGTTYQSLSITVSYVSVGLSTIKAILTGNTQLMVAGTIHANVIFGLVPVSMQFQSSTG